MSYIRRIKNRLHKAAQNGKSKLYNLVESAVKNYPRAYLGFITAFAIAGFGYILLFPVLIIISLLNIHEALTFNDALDWQTASIWLLISLIAGLVTFRAAKVKANTPAGLTLTEDKAPELFKTVQQFNAECKRPAIHRIVITGNYELDIVRTPKWAIPVWSTNTLIVGLPVLQALAPKQFECVLARRIGHFSKRENPLTNWLCQLRKIWQHYNRLYARQNDFGIEPLKWFFAVYAPFYTATSVFAARRDELDADTYAMTLYNDEQVREMVTADAVCRSYIQNQYWPAVYKIASIDRKSLPAPHTKMASAVHASLQGDRLGDLIEKTYAAKPSWQDTIPSLRDRLANIGHARPHMEENIAENAAVHYLGASMKNVVTLIDKLWLQSFLQQRKIQRSKSQEKALAEQTSSA
ncbi:MAG: M48 family metalloprotease [Gammaproteobacteria bacterium]